MAEQPCLHPMYSNTTIVLKIQSSDRKTTCFTAAHITGVPSFPARVLDQTYRDWLSTGFLIYGPLYKKGLGTQHSLSSNIESRLPSMEMWVVCYCVEAYLHCAVKLSVVTTARRPSLALKFIFACRAVWLRHVRDIFSGNVQRMPIAFTLMGLCVYFALWLWTFKYVSHITCSFPRLVCTPSVFWFKLQRKNNLPVLLQYTLLFI